MAAISWVRILSCSNKLFQSLTPWNVTRVANYAKPAAGVNEKNFFSMVIFYLNRNCISVYSCSDWDG